MHPDNGRRQRFPFRRVFGAPLVIAGVSAVGLVAALLGDGVWDTLSWVALMVPVAMTGWCFWARGKLAKPDRSL